MAISNRRHPIPPSAATAINGKPKDGIPFAPQTTASAPLPVTDGDTPPLRLIPIETVQAILGVGRTFVREKSASNDLPKPVKLGNSRKSAIRWFEHEIFDYLKKLSAQRETNRSTDNPAALGQN